MEMRGYPLTLHPSQLVDETSPNVAEITLFKRYKLCIINNIKLDLGENSTPSPSGEKQENIYPTPLGAGLPFLRFLE